MLRYAGVVLAVAGCYSPGYQDCAISCAVSGICPSGLDCVQGVCRSQSGPCGSTGGDSGADGPRQIGQWGFRKTLTMGRASATLADFPLLVQLSADTDLANFAQSDGDDIKFTLVDGTQLPHEIERFDEQTGALSAWVRYPQLVAQAQNQMYMLYGNAESVPQQNPAGVWEMEYVAVWHASDPPGLTVADSTSRNNDGAKNTSGTPAPVSTGFIGGALQFNSTPSGYFSLPPSAAAALDIVSGTLEMWMMPDANGQGLRRLIDLPVAHVHSWTVAYSYVDKNILFQHENLGLISVKSAPNSIPIGAWTHLVLAFDSNQSEFGLYLNGVLSSPSQDGTNLPQENSLLTVGGRQSAADLGFSGLLDEIRLSRPFRSLGYANNTYVNHSDPAAYVTVGPAMSLP